jgi:hypothetical protein
MAVTINASTSAGLVQTADTSGVLQLQTNSGTTALTIDTSQRAAFVAGTAAAPAITTTGDTNTGMWFPAADTIAFAEGGAEAMRLDSSGNVGIGTTAPAGKLEVNATSGAQLVLNDSASTGNGNKTVTLAAFKNGVGYHNLLINGFDLRFAIGGGVTEAMRIASNGQVLIGTTTNAGRSPPLIISNDSGTTNWAVGPSTGGSTQFYVSAGAGVYLSTTSATSWTANSDINLKNVTGKIENALDAIATLTPAKFTWKADETNTPQVGLIAQEVEKVLPEVVDKNADGYLGVRYTEVVPLLVAAIQEQQTLIVSQSELITNLTARITALEGAA